MGKNIRQGEGARRGGRVGTDSIERAGGGRGCNRGERDGEEGGGQAYG
jgi:hypothetical protein